MNKLVSVILTICLICISYDISVKEGSEVELTEAMPVDTEMIEIIEIEEIENIEVVDTPEEPRSNDTYLGNFKITYYCGCQSCSDDWGTMTATGVTAKEGRTIAVDPKVIPYGTKVMINGRQYIAEDCGGAIKGNRIDIFVNNHERARKAGVDYFDVYIAS